MMELKKQIESILFSMGRRVTLEELSRICHERDHAKILHELEVLKQELEEKQSSIVLIEDNNTFRFTVRDQFLSLVRKVVKKTELPKGVLETLALVAAKAPVLQSTIVRQRTNKAYDHLSSLENTGYITREKKGRTKLLKLTNKFFSYFDIPQDKLKEKLSVVLERHQPTIEPDIEQLGVLEVYENKSDQSDVSVRDSSEKQTSSQSSSVAEAVTAEDARISPPEIEKIVEEDTTEKNEKEDMAKVTSDEDSQDIEDSKVKKQRATGLFPNGAPPEVEARIEQRVRELLQGTSSDSTENQESASSNDSGDINETEEEEVENKKEANNDSESEVERS